MHLTDNKQAYTNAKKVRHCSKLAICCLIVLRCLHFITGLRTLAL